MKTLLLLSVMSLKPFTTDYCTGFPEGRWGKCCVLHDLHYWVGGTKHERDGVDLELKACVKDFAGPAIAELMYRGVRAGRYSPYTIPGMHWGNGWSEEVRRTPLTVEEIDSIEDLMQAEHPDVPMEIKFRFLESLRER